MGHLEDDVAEMVKRLRGLEHEFLKSMDCSGSPLDRMKSRGADRCREAAALLARLGQGKTMDSGMPVISKNRQLMDYYGVATTDQLIEAQDAHIAKLQQKLTPIRDAFPASPREG